MDFGTDRSTGSPDRYWVVGGEYRDTRFTQVRDGTTRIYGPFVSYETARARWRMAAEETRSNACMRFAIAREG